MTWLASDRIIDASGRDPFGGYLAVADGRIAEVRTDARPKSSVDLDGYSLLPGLIDAHSHLGSVVQPHGTAVPLAVVAARIFQNLGTALQEGFTTVRDLAGLDGGVVTAIRLGLIVGPRILPSGPMLSQHGGHSDWRPLFDHGEMGDVYPGLVQASRLTSGPADALAAARMALRDGAAQVKVALSGGFSGSAENPDDCQFTLEELQSVVAAARGRHTYVTAHAHYPEAIRLGLAAGVECFEHATFADPDTISDLMEHGAAVVATLAVVERLREPLARQGLRAEVRDEAARAFGAMSAMVRAAVSAGLTVGSGSDLVGPDQRHRGRELAVRASLTGPMDAILAATAVNARILHRADRIGRLQAGLAADLIAVEGNPLDDPELLAEPDRIRLVVQAGQIRKNRLPPPLDDEVERALSVSEC